MKEHKIISNKNKKPVKTWKKILIFVIAQLLLTTSILVAYNIFIGGRITVETPYGYHSYHMNVFNEVQK